MKPTHVSFALFLSFALAAGCGGGSSDTSGGGGGGGGGGLQIFHYMAIPSTNVRDGYVSEAGLVSTGGFTGFVGDDPAHQENRAVLSFNLDTLPPTGFDISCFP